MNKLNVILCTDSQKGIGKNNKIPWSLKKDMIWFKGMTINKTVIMGNNTFRSLNEKPLVNRLNIVVTKNISSMKILEEKYDNLKIVSSIEKAIAYSEVNTNSFKETFIIGGSIVYNYVITNFGYKIHRIYHTLIQKDFNCDVKLRHSMNFVKICENVYISENMKEKNLEFNISSLSISKNKQEFKLINTMKKNVEISLHKFIYKFYL